MLRNLLSPLSGRFSSVPRTVQTQSISEVVNGEPAPEEFARDVLVEIMRKSVERLKLAEGLSARTEVLLEIHRIMLEDACTKDVFREMDGFLVLMNVLSTIQPAHSWTFASPGDPIVTDVLEATRLAFAILSEALHRHPLNMTFFERSLGYEFLSKSVNSLVFDAKTANQTLGYLVALALHNFALSGIFEFTEKTDYTFIDGRLQDMEPMLNTIEHAGAIKTLYSSLGLFTDPQAAFRRYYIYKLLERLSSHSHRNLAILSTINLVGPLFDTFCTSGHEGDTPKPGTLPKPERQIVLKLLRRLLELGSTTNEAKVMFQRAVRHDDVLDGDVLEVLRAGMKTRWPEHFSMEGPSAIHIPIEASKGLPNTGFTFMVWLWLEKLPTGQVYTLFSFHHGDFVQFALRVRPDGKLQCECTASKDPYIFGQPITKSRWTHLALVHHPHRASNPTIRLFIDGALSDSVHWHYPKSDGFHKSSYCLVGDDDEEADMSWCLASAYLLSVPLSDDIPRFVQHLGPRYFARFQSSDLVKFMTYDASTSLSIYLANMSSSPKTPSISELMQAIKSGLDIGESSILFSVSPFVDIKKAGENANSTDPWLDGETFEVKSTSLDSSMWKLGGAAIPLGLVQLAQSTHEVSRALSILTGGLKNSWQNSEDMEQLRGYEILTHLLRNKSHLVNMTGFEILFEFLGLNFRTPEHSTVVNPIAYRAIALDFQLWSHTKIEIQRVHLEHFAILLEVSKHKKFNLKQRLRKMGLVRKLLFVLQTDWYQLELASTLIDTLRMVAQANFSTDDAIKPIVAYLATNLHEDVGGAASPRSVISRIDNRNAQAKAEQVLEVLISILQSSSAYNKFASALPLTRVCLLLLGEHPPSSIAEQILRLIGIAMRNTTSFSRKFELVSGWTIFKTVLPGSWSENVQNAAFDVMLGSNSNKDEKNVNVVTCPAIVPPILAALQYLLDVVVGNRAPDQGVVEQNEARSLAESLVERLIEIHSVSPTFRQVFKSQSTTQLFVEAYRSFVTALAMARTEVDGDIVRILEKLSHLGLSIALDTVVAADQKQEVLDTLQNAEAVLNPQAGTTIDPSLIVQKKSRRPRFSTMRLSVHLGERTVQRSIVRINDWRKTVTITEKKRLRKTILDLREEHRQVAALTEWHTLLTAERGLWSTGTGVLVWRLDETEGPYRVRKKLESDHDRDVDSKVNQKAHGSKINDPDADTQSLLQVEVPPWAESYEIASTDTDDRQLDEEVQEDKHRRVRHELEPGDVIEAVSTVARISGVDSSPGLLIFGRTHLYMLDGLVENEDGEVIEAHDAPKRLFFVPGSIVELDGPQRALRWSYDQIINHSDRTCLFRDVALEIYFKDSRSLLVVFLDKAQRQATNDRLSSISNGRYSGDLLTPGGLLKSPMVVSPLMGRLSARVSARVSARTLMPFRADELSSAQRKWQAREISNFAYISILNQLSGRTPSDATQYPVFPWVISDYSSDTLDLDVHKTFRDLTKPMGALTEARREAAETRYKNLESVGEKPFHYGTHFSSSMIVCHFLIRLAPFTHMFKTLQGGDWDLPDRLFADIRRAYQSAATDVRGDVRELIPEFYSCPEFLENSQNLDFGVQQNTGERIHDVKLPPWAKQDPMLFIDLNRQALESDYVSRNLPAWIDLIWGYKQRDPDSLNVFHPLSYEGSIDLDSITDELEMEATVGIIHNFGQTPRKLFTSPHPDRMMHGSSSLPIGTIYGIAEDYHLLSQGSKVRRDLGIDNPVYDLGIDTVSERVVPCTKGQLMIPSRPHEIIEWDPSDASSGVLKVLVDKKIVQVAEEASCSCAAFADLETLVTGSLDYTVRLWKVARGAGVSSTPRYGDPPLRLVMTHLMRSHSASVVCVAASRTWSLVVSGSKDGSTALWDLNRGVYVRSIWHSHSADSPVHLVAINESTGHIASCSKTKLWLHTVNARPIVSLDLTDVALSPLYPPITSLAFLERDYCKRGVLATGSPDGTISLRTWNTDNTPPGEKARWEFVTLKTLLVKSANGERKPKGQAPCVTALKFIGESLYHGEDTGKVFAWELPD
ncbi:hypothetical protein ABKN59_005526 [Abortiporus biennis]